MSFLRFVWTFYRLSVYWFVGYSLFLLVMGWSFSWIIAHILVNAVLGFLMYGEWRHYLETERENKTTIEV